MLYIERIVNLRKPSADDGYPYDVPSIRNLRDFVFRKDVTFFVGENGAGKSTLVEAIAVNAGFNPEGGGRNFGFRTADTHSELYRDLRLVRGPVRNRDGYFLRAESMYNLATEIDQISYGIHGFYGGRSLHKRSHGESFLTVFTQRFFGNGLYILDEPESAFSARSVLAMMVRIRQLVEQDSQFIIATHSPLLLAYPGADIWMVGENGLERVDYKDTDPYRVTKFFLENPERMLDELFGEE